MTTMPDGIWRPEEHPVTPGDWIAVRHYDNGLRHVREVSTYRSGPGLERVRRFKSAAEAQAACDRLNPLLLEKLACDLSGSQMQWLRRLAGEPDGVMERAVHAVLLSLEVLELVTSKAEPGRPGMDRWTITEDGRAELARR